MARRTVGVVGRNVVGRVSAGELAIAFGVVLGVVLFGGCTEPSQSRVTFPALGEGEAPREIVVDAWRATLTEARVAFGPAYFCATAAADVDLCPTAVAELRASATFDALDPSLQMLGTMSAVTATVRSGMFDYGRTWFLPASRSAPTEGAVDGAHSARLRARATHDDGRTFELVADVDIDALVAGTSVVRAFRTMHSITGANDAMVVHVDASAWLAGLDYDELDALRGDDDVLEVPAGSHSMNALVVALTNQGLPTIRWEAGDR